MPAPSKASSRFWKLVKAVKDGEVAPGKVTQNVRDAAHDTSSQDVKDLTKPEKNAPERVMNKDKSSGEKEDKKDEGLNMQASPALDLPGTSDQDESMEPEGLNFFEIVGRYNEYGNMLRREHTLSELAQQLSSIAEYAEYALTNETSDWYDANTVRRNLKEMQGYAKQFAKIAEDADAYHMQMEALYEDMGHILERYFEIYDTQRMNQEMSSPEVGEVFGDQGDAPFPKKQFPTNPEYDKPPEQRKVDECDPLTERAINIARARLNERDAAMFDSMPTPRKALVAWRMIAK